MNYETYLARMREKVERDLLPDTCQIITPTGTPTVSPSGVITFNEAYREYNGSADIPCRLDTSRSFRPEKLPNQEVNANEYALHLPLGVYVAPNDKVIVVKNGRTHTFEVRKITALSAWSITTEALVIELEFQHGR